jgi:hypothetical protein
MTSLVECMHHHKLDNPMVGEALSFPLEFLDTLGPIVDFNLVQYFTTNRFSIKE